VWRGVQVLLWTQRGGHVCFFDMLGADSWLTRVLLEFIDACCAERAAGQGECKG
jgi:predicted alpha/beta-fold hydrolase